MQLRVNSDDESSVEIRPFTDGVSLCMTRQRLPLHIEKLGKSDIVLGTRVAWGASEITYRVENNVLMITCYQRTRKTNVGLRNGFKDMLDWLNIVKNEVPEIKWIVGCALPLSSDPLFSKLSLTQLKRFYHDIMRAQEAPDLGDKWYRYDIAKLQTIREQLRLNKMDGELV